VKLDMGRGTVFQQKAWRELQKIPYGDTISYGEQAKRVGDPKKARAVGMANGRNPICIIIPCHRVIGSSGSLVGFGGGLNTKKLLLILNKKLQNLQKPPLKGIIFSYLQSRNPWPFAAFCRIVRAWGKAHR